jgi:hypothetical protein
MSKIPEKSPATCTMIIKIIRTRVPELKYLPVVFKVLRVIKSVTSANKVQVNQSERRVKSESFSSLLLLNEKVISLKKII